MGKSCDNVGPMPATYRCIKNAWKVYSKRCKEAGIPRRSWWDYRTAWNYIRDEVKELLLHRGLEWNIPRGLGRLYIHKQRNFGRCPDWNASKGTGRIIYRPVDKEPFLYKYGFYGYSREIKFVRHYKVLPSKPMIEELRRARREGYDYIEHNERADMIKQHKQVLKDYRNGKQTNKLTDDHS